MIVLGYQSLTVSTSVVTLTLPSGKMPRAANIAVSGQPIRFTRDGLTTPSASVGLRAIAGQYIHLVSTEQIQNFKAIREGGSDATIAIEYVDYLDAQPVVTT
jgi:hypothetical protein